MKKVLGVIFFLCSLALAANFYGNQSLNGLQTVSLFTAPLDGYYFINGQLYLPQIPLGSSSGSQVRARILKNGNAVTPVYVGISGASGFSIRKLSLASGDYVTVGLESNATVDQGLNKVRGQVYYGNAF